jgi:hypothetical protein
MTHLSQGLISRFQKTHIEKFGKQISLEVAESELLGLAELVRIAIPQKIKNIESHHGTATLY